MFKHLKNYLLLYIKSFALFWRAAKLSSALLLILIPIQALAPVLLINLAQAMLDDLLKGSFAVNTIVVWGMLLFISSIAIPINTALQGILTDKLIAFVNLQLMKKSQSIQGLALFENADFYDNLQVVSSEASWRPVNLIVFGISCVRECITIVAMVLLLSQYNVWIALLLLVSIIPQSIISYRIQQNAFETMVTRSPDARKLQYYSEVLLKAKDAKDVRIFNAAHFFIHSYQKLYDKMHQKVTKVRVKQMLVSVGLLSFSVVLSIVSLVWMIHSILNHQVSVGGFLVFVSTLTAVATSVYSFIENSSLLYDTLLYMQQYFKFMETQEPDDYGGTQALPTPFQQLSFAHLSFSYQGQTQLALNDVSFTVHAGEKIAIVGENGSGKSTLVKLMMRFYTPSAGDIRFNQQMIQNIKIETYRKAFSAVFQDYAQWSLPIRNSIGLGNPTQMGDDDQIIAAMKKSGFYDDFQSKQLDLNDTLGKSFKDGVGLSGGQWQKVAIAQAMMADAPILVLDEPTASLDPRSEFAIYDKFLKMAMGKTVFFITHRMSAVNLSDKVLVIQHGQLVAFGTHQDLLKQNDYYHELYDLQAKAFKE